MYSQTQNMYCKIYRIVLLTERKDEQMFKYKRKTPSFINYILKKSITTLGMLLVDKLPQYSDM